MTTAVAWQNATGLVTVIIGPTVLTHWNNANAEFRLRTFDTAEEARTHTVGVIARSERLGNSIPFGPVAFELPDAIIYEIEEYNSAPLYDSWHFYSWPLLHRVAAALATTPKWRPPSESLVKIAAGI